MELMTHLLLLVTLARVLGAVAKSLGYLEIIGEIIAGLLLGPAILDIVHPSEALGGIVQLAVFFLIFSAGLEMELHEIINALKIKSLLVAASGFFLPLVAGIGIGTVFSLGFMQSVCIGLCMAITALPVVIRFLSSAGVLDTEFGHNIVGSAIIIDVAALLVLGIVFDTGQITGVMDLLTTVANTGLKMGGFFLLIMIVNKLLRSEIETVQRTERAFQSLIERVGKEAIFGLGVFFVMVFATISESLGFHFIIGTFFGGLLLNKDIIGKDYFKIMNHNLDSIANGFLTPVFFAYIGLRFSSEAFDEVWVATSILLVGYLFKMLGAYAGAQLAGISKTDSLKIGVLLNSRGVLDLIVADLAFERGYISSTVFSILVVLGISSVIVNPLIYQRIQRASAALKPEGLVPDNSESGGATT